MTRQARTHILAINPEVVVTELRVRCASLKINVCVLRGESTDPREICAAVEGRPEMTSAPLVRVGRSGARGGSDQFSVSSFSSVETDFFFEPGK